MNSESEWGDFLEDLFGRTGNFERRGDVVAIGLMFQLRRNPERCDIFSETLDNFLRLIPTDGIIKTGVEKFGKDFLDRVLLRARDRAVELHKERCGDFDRRHEEEIKKYEEK